MKLFFLILTLLFISGTASFGSVDIFQKRSNGELPLKVIESSIESTLPMVIYISGDGGWNTFSESLCNYLSKNGFPVVILNAKKYFWDRKTPEETVTDLVTIIEAYGTRWKRDKFILTGFSFGASLVPFIVNRFPAGISDRLSSSIMINPDMLCDFEIHLSDMLNMGPSKGDFDVIREMKSIDARKTTIFFGSDESIDLQQTFQKTGAKVQIVPGNHHFDDDYEALAEMLVKAMTKK
ncbi:MAG: hypothetical protein NTZ69_03375 [Bacteroidia bacterium]|nr:hypothetical protein [Bacteroidia bacterium]